MREAAFPEPVSKVVNTLIAVFRHAGRRSIVELLESAHAYFDETEYDNWNGGTYTWALRLDVPVTVFASCEASLEDVEKEIGAKLRYFDRKYPNDHLGEVTISPVEQDEMPLGQRLAPSDFEVRRLWSDGRFRLFLSHVSKHKVAVSCLKKALSLRGVDAFVAHEDIEPSREWQHEIEVGLRSMHALAALITADFRESKWTDQEVGWALGRGIPLVPLRLGADPYGLAGKFQGVAGTLEQPEVLAEAIVRTLLTNSQSQGEMRRALVRAFAEASSSTIAEATSRLLVGIAGATDDERDALWRACTDNAHVANAPGVASAIYAAFGAPALPATSEAHDDIPF